MRDELTEVIRRAQRKHPIGASPEIYADAIIAALSDIVQLPRRGAESGWTLDPSLLMETTHEIEREGWDANLEIVELAMLAAERRILSAFGITEGEM